MPNFIRRAVYHLLPLLCFTLHAQTWVKVANEGDTVAATAITVRYGSGTSWVTQTLSGTFTVSNTTFGDPDPGVLKELDLLETSVPQTVMVNGIWMMVPANVVTTLLSQPSATVSIPAQTVPLPAVTLPKFTCSVSGKTATCPAMTLPAGSVTVPAQTLPVTVSGPGFALSCPNPPDAQGNYQNCTLTVGK